MSPARKKATAKKPPVVKTRSAGRISSTLDHFASKYLERYPDRDVRYVFHPEGKEHLSGVTGRHMQGYHTATLGELGAASTSDEEEKPIRVGDVILMWIGKEERQAIKDDLRQRAIDQKLAVDRQYRDALDQAADEADSNHGRPPLRAIGRAAIEEKEHEYEISQREE